MLIWFAMFIPVVAAIVLAVFFRPKVLKWELFVPFGAALFTILLSKTCVEMALTRDTEYHSGWAVQAEYFEDWTELVTYTETVRDSKGNTHTVTKTRHEYHPPYWMLKDSNGYDISITQPRYTWFARRFGGEKHEQIWRLNRVWGRGRGDKFVSVWPGTQQTFEPVTTTHSYENRVQASRSVFNFKAADPKSYGLFEYPDPVEGYQCRSVLGSGDAERAFAEMNARLGRAKQLRVWVLLFKDKPLQAALEQEQYWKGGNKNEFVICIGTDSQQAVKWCYVFSWTEVEALKIDTRDFVQNQLGRQLDLLQVAQWLEPQLSKRYVRKQFEDFDYLTVEPPTWAVVLCYIFVFAVTAGVSVWVVKNDHQEFYNRRW